MNSDSCDPNKANNATHHEESRYESPHHLWRTFTCQSSVDDLSFAESVSPALTLTAASVAMIPTLEDAFPSCASFKTLIRPSGSSQYLQELCPSISQESLATTFRSETYTSCDDEVPVDHVVTTNGESYNVTKTVLGQGYFGTVYLGLGTMGTFAAIKILRESKSFLTSEEIQVLLKLQHPNVVRYYGVTSYKSQRVTVMEYVSGGSLDSILACTSALPVRRVAKYCYDVLSGLAYLHSNGIWHRDIKPQNILVGTDGVCKLTDFGLAIVLSPSLDHVDTEDAAVGEQHGSSRSGIGTVAYMPPEAFQLQWYETSDVWSFGVTLYQLLTSQLPWEVDCCSGYPETTAYVLRKSAWKQKPIPSSVSDSATQILQQCLQIDYIQRPKAHELQSHSFFKTYLVGGESQIKEDDSPEE